MLGHVRIELNGRSYIGDYDVDGDVVSVTLNGRTRAAVVEHMQLMLVTRRLLRELVLEEAPSGCA